MRSGPIDIQNRIKKCPSCYFQFTKSSEMHFCEFCGNSNDAKCLKKTRIFPLARKDENGERARGKICKLCDRKFMVKKDVDEIKSLF